MEISLETIEKCLQEYKNLSWLDWLFCRRRYHDLMRKMKLIYFQAKKTNLPRGRIAERFVRTTKKLEELLVKERVLVIYKTD